MNPAASLLIDRTALILWTACVHFGLFGIALLVPIAVWHRRPAARHFLALTALVAALGSPLTAACALRLGFAWTPLPARVRLADGAIGRSIASAPSLPSLAPVPPPREVVSATQTHGSQFPLDSRSAPTARAAPQCGRRQPRMV
jgi:hypothetical protein